MRFTADRWRDSEPEEVRSWITEVNDGIIAVAGMGLGLAGAEVSLRTAYAVVCINALIGALTSFGVKLGERYADREAEEDLARRQSTKFALTPEAEKSDLIEWFQSHGVTPATARTVADELGEGNALDAQLLIEYGLKDRTTTFLAWIDALQAGLAFLIGAAVPMLATLLIPGKSHVIGIAVVASLSLVITSFVLAHRGHSNIRATIGRSLVIGLITITASYFLGDLLL